MVVKMLTVTDKTDFYFRYIEEINDRLDYVFYHPKLDTLDKLPTLTRYDICELGGNIDGLSLIKDITSGSTPKDLKFDKNGIMFLRANNVLEDSLDLSDVLRIERTFHEGTLKSSKLMKNDVLVTMAGTIGRSCVYDFDEEANINQAIARIRVNEKVILPDYLSLYFNSNFGQFGFLKYRHDVGQPNINLEEIKRIKIIVPPVEEQKKIVFKVLDKKREAIEIFRNIENKEEVYRIILDKFEFDKNKNYGYFFKSASEKKTLSFYKFPDEIDDRIHYLFYHPKYEILEQLKNKYKLVKLRNIVKEPIIRGEQPEYAQNGITVVKTVDLKNGYIDYENCLKVSEEFFKSYVQKHPEGVLRKGDILIASTGYVSMGKVDIYDRDEPAMVDGHISILRVKSDYDPYFVAYYLRSHLGQIQFDKWWSGSSGQIEIQPQDLEELLIPESTEDGIPLEKQKEIAQEITENLNELFELEKQANEKWEEAKKLFEKMILERIEDVEATE